MVGHKINEVSMDRVMRNIMERNDRMAKMLYWNTLGLEYCGG